MAPILLLRAYDHPGCTLSTGIIVCHFGGILWMSRGVACNGLSQSHLNGSDNKNIGVLAVCPNQSLGKHGIEQEGIRLNP